MGVVDRLRAWRPKPPSPETILFLTVLAVAYLIVNRETHLRFLFGTAPWMWMDWASRTVHAFFAVSWLTLIGRLLLLGLAGLIAYRVARIFHYAQEQRRQDRMERENGERMWRAREQAQKLLEQTAAEQAERERREAAELAREREEEALRRQQAEVENRDRNAKSVQDLQTSTAATTSAVAQDAALQQTRTQQAAAGVAAAKRLNAARLEEQQQQRLRELQEQMDLFLAQQKAAREPVASPSPPTPAEVREAGTVPGAAASSQEPTSSSGAVGGGGGGTAATMTRRVGSASSMIPLDVAREAEERQRRWLQQLQAQVDPSEAARQAYAADRAIREQTDAEYAASLSADRQRQAEAQEAARQAEEAARQAEEERMEKAARKARLEQRRAALQARFVSGNAAPDTVAEPPEGEEGCVAFRVRLPNGSNHVRRFRGSETVALLYDWVDSLAGMPLLEPGAWSLVTAYPRALASPDTSVAGLAAGARQVALFVEEK